MQRTVHELEIDRLLVEDRLALAQEIWDSIAQEVERGRVAEVERSDSTGRSR